MILAIWLSFNSWQPIEHAPLVSGVVDISDPNHPIEIYYGRPEFQDLNSMTADLGITIFKEDKAQTFPIPGMGLGSKITIQRALPVLVDDGGNLHLYRSWKTQIKEFLAEQKIVLGDQDRIDPDLNTWLRPEMKIAIIRVNETELKEEEDIPYKTITKDDPTMEKGQSKVSQVGKTGKKIKTFLVRRENGQEVSRELLGEEVSQKPQDKIIIVGTKIVEIGRGTATWYDLISGNAAAHNTLPKGTMVKVTNLNNGKSVVVKIIDRGIMSGAIIDLSAEAFSQIAPLGAGVIPVRLTKE